MKDAGKDTAVDLVEGGHISLLFTELEIAQAHVDYAAAKNAGVDVDEVHFIPKDEVLKVSTGCNSPCSADKITEIRRGVSCCPHTRSQYLAPQTRHSPLQLCKGDRRQLFHLCSQPPHKHPRNRDPPNRFRPPLLSPLDAHDPTRRRLLLIHPPRHERVRLAPPPASSRVVRYHSYARTDYRPPRCCPPREPHSHRMGWKRAL